MIKAIIDNLHIQHNWIISHIGDNASHCLSLRHPADAPGTFRYVIIIDTDTNTITIYSGIILTQLAIIDISHPDSLNQLYKIINK